MFSFGGGFSSNNNTANNNTTQTQPSGGFSFSNNANNTNQNPSGFGFVAFPPNTTTTTSNTNPFGNRGFLPMNSNNNVNAGFTFGLPPAPSRNPSTFSFGETSQEYNNNRQGRQSGGFTFGAPIDLPPPSDPIISVKTPPFTFTDSNKGESSRESRDQKIVEELRRDLQMQKEKYEQEIEMLQHQLEQQKHFMLDFVLQTRGTKQFEQLKLELEKKQQQLWQQTHSPDPKIINERNQLLAQLLQLGAEMEKELEKEAFLIAKNMILKYDPRFIDIIALRKLKSNAVDVGQLVSRLEKLKSRKAELQKQFQIQSMLCRENPHDSEAIKQKQIAKEEFVKCIQEMDTIREPLVQKANLSTSSPTLFSFTEVRKHIIEIDDFALLDDSLYAVQKKLSNRCKVFEQKRTKEWVVLEQYNILEARLFARKEKILKKCKQSVLDRFFPILQQTYSDSSHLYLETKFIEGVSLKDWIQSGERSLTDVQKVLQKLARSLSFLHENGLIHGSLTSESVLISTDKIPVITGFNYCATELEPVEPHRLDDAYIKKMGHFAEPNVRQTKTVTAKNDVYSFGCILIECFSKKAAGYVPYDVLKQRAKEVLRIFDEDILGLLDGIFGPDRIDSHHIWVHPLFDKHLEAQEVYEKEARTNLAAVKTLLQEKQSRHGRGRANVLRVDGSSPEKLYSDALQQLRNLSSSNILSEFQVSFRNEAGVDAGGLTSSFYHRFFTATIECKRFIRHEKSHVYSIAVDDISTDPLEYELIGILLAKMVFDRRPLPFQLASHIIKFLIAVDESKIQLTWSDLYMADPILANSLKMVLEEKDVSFLGFDFSDISKEEKERPVTDSNKREYFEKKLQWTLLGSMKQNLTALKKGFQKIEELQPIFALIYHPYTLSILLSGNCGEELDVKKFAQHNFLFEGGNYTLRQWVQEVISELTPEEAQSLLLFATGIVQTQNSYKIFENPNTTSSNRDKICFRFLPNSDKNQLPVSHTCFYRVDCPEYSSKQILKQKLMQAISYTGDYFGIA